MTEAARPPLRRLDWRFVLPSPPDGAPFRRMLVTGGPPGIAELAVSCGLAAEAVQREPGYAPAERMRDGRAPDLVAALDGAAVPRSLLHALAPDAVVYREVRRLTPAALARRSRARIERKFADVGLASVGVYAALAGFDRCHGYLPLDVDAALAWWTDSLFPAPTARRRIVELALRRGLASSPARLARAAPHLAFVAARGAFIARPPSVLGHAEVPVALRAREVRPFAFVDAGNRAVLLPFSRTSRSPLAVLKVPKLPSVSDRTEHEHVVMKRVRKGMPGHLHATVPEPVGLVRWGGVAVAVESCIAGTSMLRSTGRWGGGNSQRIADLRAAAGWLADFHSTAAVETDRREQPVADWLDEVVAEYAGRFGLEPAEVGLFEALHERADTLRGSALPVVWHHRDFNVWNVLRRGDGIAVIDWEGARPGPPLVDLLHFATHWHETARRLRTVEAQTAATRELWIGSPRWPLARAVREAVHAYLDRLGIDRRVVPPLLGYLWAELAVRRSRQQADLRQPRATPRAGNRNFAFIAAIAKSSAELVETWT